MVYVALLRGINVGGKNKIDMKLLKKTFERVQMKDVITYINTGNIIFTSGENSKKVIGNMLEQAISEDFGLNIKVVVRSLEEYKQVILSLPESWTNDGQQKSDVLFLWDEIDDDSILDKLTIKEEIDTVKYVPGAIIWSVSRENVTKSGMKNIVGSKIYHQVTVRNVNTTRKIYELMLSVAN
ncbi:DUF1697 domain-containing protein [Caldibacillus lycopersici]|uniref:DUF1697 domain-containing protein n=1 Tax=Perspicuibacillus lycopersici TaxID=1325689 RepID=A0AAE3LMM0_9BACI|nr:DUF1697 domain-containing protein [Perspicuibacillus lycopersici]MCU9612897.1 DUF1697 domain-containing protein [Perspicuibacillus lycopersici]